MTNIELFQQFYLVVLAFTGVFGFSIGLIFFKGLFR